MRQTYGFSHRAGKMARHFVGLLFSFPQGFEPVPRSGGFGGARTRAGIYSEHVRAEEAEGRYPSLSAILRRSDHKVGAMEDYEKELLESRGQ